MALYKISFCSFDLFMIIEIGNPDDLTCSISAAKVSKFL